MILPYNSRLKTVARTLRKNSTDSERLLWSRLRRKQLKEIQFFRQKVLGNYIVDFYCHRAKLVIEIDGGGHFNKEQIESDRVRDEYLKERGLKVLRFSSNDVMTKIDLILERIYDEL